MYVSENHIQTRLNNLDSNQNVNNKDDFDVEICCFFCGKAVKQQGGKLHKNVTALTISDDFLQSVEAAIAKRSIDDEWTQMVADRIRSSAVFIGAQSSYHNNCRIGFRTNKALPKSKTSPVVSYRPGFLEVVNLIQTAKNPYSIKDLIDEMDTLSDGNGYSFNQMKHNLIQYFGNTIIISTHQNKKTLVTLESTCHEILNEHYEASLRETDIDKAIRKVSDVILNDIKNVPHNKTTYPSTTDISLCDAQQFLPEKLHRLLSNLITGHNAPLKIVSIGQAIVQSSHRENVLSPLQIALAVQMHYFTGSK